MTKVHYNVAGWSVNSSLQCECVRERSESVGWVSVFERGFNCGSGVGEYVRERYHLNVCEVCECVRERSLLNVCEVCYCVTCRSVGCLSASLERGLTYRSMGMLVCH